jgi:UDP-galactose transporter B1
MTSSNMSIAYVSYPTMVLFKSCKLIPAMLTGSLLQGKVYRAREWLAATCISAGIALFHLSSSKRLHTENNKEDGRDSIVGLLLLILSLTMDGLLSSCQSLMKHDNEKKRIRPPSAVETMFFVNLYALLFLIPLAMWSGEWSEGIKILRLQHQPQQQLQRDVHDDYDAAARMARTGLAYMCGAASMGQIFVFLTITWFSPLVCTTITTTRKFFTILLSVLHFGHVFNMRQWMSVSLVFGGIYMGIADKSRSGITTMQRQQQLTRPVAVAREDEKKKVR